jgi:hypothetical protein
MLTLPDNHKFGRITQKGPCKNLLAHNLLSDTNKCGLSKIGHILQFNIFYPVGKALAFKEGKTNWITHARYANNTESLLH